MATECSLRMPASMFPKHKGEVENKESHKESAGVREKWGTGSEEANWPIPAESDDTPQGPLWKGSRKQEVGRGFRRSPNNHREPSTNQIQCKSLLDLLRCNGNTYKLSNCLHVYMSSRKLRVYLDFRVSILLLLHQLTDHLPIHNS